LVDHVTREQMTSLVDHVTSERMTSLVDHVMSAETTSCFAQRTEYFIKKYHIT